MNKQKKGVPILGYAGKIFNKYHCEVFRLRLWPWAIFLIFCIGLLNAGDINSAEPKKKQVISGPGQGLLLEDCLRLAMTNSFEVKLARLDFLIKETDLGLAEAVFDAAVSVDVNYEEDKREPLSVFGADRKQTNAYSLQASKELPSGTEVTLSLSDERSWDNSGYTSQNPAHSAEVELEIRQPFGKNIFGYVDRRKITVTSLAIQNADLDTKERIELLLANVQRSYWRWAFSRQNQQIHREILAKAKELHRVNAKNYGMGIIERADFLASKANVLIREKDVQLAENQYRQAEEEIKLLMNIDAKQRYHPKEELQYNRPGIAFEDCLRQAFAHRRDYRKSKRELEIKNIVLETKANERWPEIDLVASLNANGVDAKFSKAARELAGDDQCRYYAALEVTIPLENNLARSEFAKAQHKKERAILTLKNIERTIVTQVGNAFRRYSTYEINLAKLTAACALQQEKLKEEERRFKYGRSNTKRLIDYQQDYLNAQLQLAQGLLEWQLARIDLEKTLNIILNKYAGLL